MATMKGPIAMVRGGNVVVIQHPVQLAGYLTAITKTGGAHIEGVIYGWLSGHRLEVQAYTLRSDMFGRCLHPPMMSPCVLTMFSSKLYWLQMVSALVRFYRNAIEPWILEIWDDLGHPRTLSITNIYES